jgi:hypothetical protein
MMAFEFPEITRAKLNAVHPDSERHGEMLVPRTDIRLQLDLPNSVLERFAPGLRDMFYIAGTPAADELPGIEPVSDATELRFPELGMPQSWSGKTGGYTLVIDYGIGERYLLRLTDCTLHKLTFAAKKGGTCTVSFTLSCSEGLNAETLGHLGMHVQHDVHFQLTQPVVEMA